MSNLFDELINRPGQRSDIKLVDVSVKAYWCGEVLRFDVQFPKGGK